MSTNILFDPLIYVNEVYFIMPSLFTTFGPNMIIHVCFCFVKENTQVYTYYLDLGQVIVDKVV